MAHLGSPVRSKPLKRTYLDRHKKKQPDMDIHLGSDRDSDSDVQDSPKAASVKGKLMGDMRPPNSINSQSRTFKHPDPPNRLAQKQPTSPPMKDPVEVQISLSGSNIAGTTRKKPASVRSNKPISRSQADSETEQDDGASVAESFASFSQSGSTRVRRSETERMEYFKNQPECDSNMEPHRVKCTRCQKYVNLGKKQTYTVRPWENHRARCDQKPPVSFKNETESITGSESPVNEASRKAYLESDVQALHIKPNEVCCKRCRKWVALGAQPYSLGNWKKHLTTCSDIVPSTRVAMYERKLRLVNDAQARSFGPGHVDCLTCRNTIMLGGDNDYQLTNWELHKSTCSTAAPASVASEATTVVETTTNPSLKRLREESELPDDDPDARPPNRPRSVNYQPVTTNPPSILGWFMMPFKEFARGFMGSLNIADTTSSS